MHRLIVRHEASEGEFRFVVQRVRLDGIKSAPAVGVPDPLNQRMDESTLHLGGELNWYLERYLDYPFGPNQQRADRVVEALQLWGASAFERLFDKGQARDFYRDATRDTHANLHLTIVSDSAKVLAWPWEALRDPLVGDLAHHCRIERQLDRIEDPPQLNPNLNHDRIGILLVTARPYKQDISYRTVSRPLVHLIFDQKLPVDVKVLRPPTLKQLRTELEASAEFYHIVHFDGHGSFGQDNPSAGHQSPQRVGHLAFEDAEGAADLVTGAQLSQLLREHRIPIVVMNACQSAMLDANAEDAFAAVATSLLRSGVRSVVAMGYSLYASAAREFLPAFYERLFGIGDVAEATRAGRQALLAKPERRLGFNLQDWLVPVLYQQEPLALNFAKTSPAQPPEFKGIIPEEARLGSREAPHGFVGRDSAVLALERASRRPPAGLLVHGLGGVGKTALLKGYIEWLGQTRGLAETVIWFSFNEVRSFDYVLNRMTEQILGTKALSGSDEEKWQAVCRHLRERAALIVWDNFEVVSGQDDAVSDLVFPSAERGQLKQFLEELRGGRSRVLLSSRTSEQWLGTIACYRVPIGGLEGEERHALARAILSDQGIRFNPRDQELADLIDSLDGHPLMMRALLPQLAFRNAKTLRDEFETYLPSVDGDNEAERRLAAILRYVDSGLPDRLKPLLYPIGLHVVYVRLHYLEEMAKLAKEPFSAKDISETLNYLERAGLVRSEVGDYYVLHPALARYLNARARDAKQSASWQDGFINVAKFLVGTASFSNLKEQRAFHRVFGGSIERARNLVDRRDWEVFDGLTAFLANFAQANGEPHRAKRLYEEMLNHLPPNAQDGARAAGTHINLGLTALKEANARKALTHFQHARELFQTLGRKDGIAVASQYIGLAHFGQHNIARAEYWFANALKLFQNLNDEQKVSYLLHELGSCAHRRGQVKKAETLYGRSVEIKERLGDEEGAAITYQMMAVLAGDRGDLTSAETWYNRALSVAQAGEDVQTQSYIYHGLGVIAQDRGEFVEAERLYVKSLQLKEEKGDRHGASLTYHQLGQLSLLRSDFKASEQWAQQSLAVSKELNDKEGLGKSYVQLGLIAKLQGNPQLAEVNFLQASRIATQIKDKKMLKLIDAARRGPRFLDMLIEGVRNWLSPR